jgi:hypothetical protein
MTTPHCSDPACGASLVGAVIDRGCVACPRCGTWHGLTGAQVERLRRHQQPELPGVAAIAEGH